MQSLLAAQQLLTTANSGLSAAQQQQLLASMSSSLSQVRTSTIIYNIYNNYNYLQNYLCILLMCKRIKLHINL